MRILVKALMNSLEFNFYEKKKVNTLTVNQSFGEVSLKRNKLRTATVLSKSHCVFAVLTKEIYQKYLEQPLKQIFKARIEYLKNIPLFNSWQQEGLEILDSQHLTEQKFKVQQTIFKEGQSSEYIYIVIKGEIELSVALDEEDLQEVDQEDEEQYENENIQLLNGNLVEEGHSTYQNKTADNSLEYGIHGQKQSRSSVLFSNSKSKAKQQQQELIKREQLFSPKKQKKILVQIVNIPVQQSFGELEIIEELIDDPFKRPNQCAPKRITRAVAKTEVVLRKVSRKQFLQIFQIYGHSFGDIQRISDIKGEARNQLVKSGLQIQKLQQNQSHENKKLIKVNDFSISDKKNPFHIIHKLNQKNYFHDQVQGLIDENAQKQLRKKKKDEGEEDGENIQIQSKYTVFGKLRQQRVLLQHQIIEREMMENQDYKNSLIDPMNMFEPNSKGLINNMLLKMEITQKINQQQIDPNQKNYQSKIYQNFKQAVKKMIEQQQRDKQEHTKQQHKRQENMHVFAQKQSAKRLQQERYKKLHLESLNQNKRSSSTLARQQSVLAHNNVRSDSLQSSQYISNISQSYQSFYNNQTAGTISNQKLKISEMQRQTDESRNELNESNKLQGIQEKVRQFSRNNNRRVLISVQKQDKPDFLLQTRSTLNSIMAGNQDTIKNTIEDDFSINQRKVNSLNDIMMPNTSRDKLNTQKKQDLLISQVFQNFPSEQEIISQTQTQFQRNSVSKQRDNVIKTNFCNISTKSNTPAAAIDKPSERNSILISGLNINRITKSQRNSLNQLTSLEKLDNIQNQSQQRSNIFMSQAGTQQQESQHTNMFNQKLYSSQLFYSTPSQQSRQNSPDVLVAPAQSAIHLQQTNLKIKSMQANSQVNNKFLAQLSEKNIPKKKSSQQSRNQFGMLSPDQFKLLQEQKEKEIVKRRKAESTHLRNIQQQFQYNQSFYITQYGQQNKTAKSLAFLNNKPLIIQQN